jgi:hypothetical protein
MAATFPMLELPEILECLTELGMNVTEESLVRPVSEQVIRLMEQLLDTFMGYTAEDNAQIKFEGMDVFEHPEIHEYSVGQLAFNRSL